MFLMKRKFTIYKSFYIYSICQIYTVNIAKDLHASGGGAILAHIWAKNCFSPICSYWFIRTKDQV